MVVSVEQYVVMYSIYWDSWEIMNFWMIFGRVDFVTIPFVFVPISLKKDFYHLAGPGVQGREGPEGKLILIKLYLWMIRRAYTGSGAYCY